MMFAHATRQIAVFLFFAVTALYPLPSANAAGNEEAKALRETFIRIKAGINSGITFRRFSTLTAALNEEFEIYKYTAGTSGTTELKEVEKVISKITVARSLWAYKTSKECELGDRLRRYSVIFPDTRTLTKIANLQEYYYDYDYDYKCGLVLLNSIEFLGVDLEPISMKPLLPPSIFYEVKIKEYVPSILAALPPDIHSAILLLE